METKAEGSIWLLFLLVFITLLEVVSESKATVVFHVIVENLREICIMLSTVSFNHRCDGIFGRKRKGKGNNSLSPSNKIWYRALFGSWIDGEKFIKGKEQNGGKIKHCSVFVIWFMFLVSDFLCLIHGAFKTCFGKKFQKQPFVLKFSKIIFAKKWII